MTYAPTRYLTLDQLREKLGGRSRSSIYRDLENGHIPKPFRIGSRLYWCEEEVEDFLKTRRLGKI